MPDIAELQTRIASPVLLPSDPGFAGEVTGFNRAVTHVPDAVIVAESEADILESVRFARENTIPVRVQSTGHGASAPYGDGLLITTSRLHSVSIDPDARTATFGAGVRWAEIVAASARHGLMPVTGSAPGVGAVGFLLGGGLGPLARSHGFGSDYLRHARVVTGHGELVEASERSHPDLFWALRGGKGGLGIVTEATVALVELDTLYAGSMMFEEEHLETVLRAWIDWTRTAPPALTTSVALMRFPPFEMVPEPLRGRHLLALRFAFAGPVDEGAALADTLRDFAPVYLDMLGELPAAQLGQVHNDPTEPMPAWDRGVMLSSVDQDLATELLALVGPGTQPPVMITEIRHLGEQTAQDVASGSAVGGRDGAYTLGFIGAAPELFDSVLPEFADRVFDAITAWRAPTSTINLVGHIGSPEEFARAWPADTFDRLRGIRAHYDPQGVFPYGVH
jgi:FAD/FMN-containing dehydrogenase